MFKGSGRAQQHCGNVDSTASCSKQEGSQVAFERMYQLPGELPSDINIRLLYSFESVSDALPSILSAPLADTVTELVVMFLMKTIIPFAVLAAGSVTFPFARTAKSLLLIV
jgi:hypothetical protein